MSNVFIKPAMIDVAGLGTVLAHVRDPLSMIPLAKDGEWKPLSSYWVRRLRDKEVVEVAPPAVPAAPAKPAA
jgi:Protein of unknown function (DUF2635)